MGVEAERADSWIGGGVGCVVAAGLLALGLVDGGALVVWVVASMVLLAGASILGGAQRPGSSVLAALLAAMAVFTAIQLIPLPPSLLAALSSAAHDVLTFGLDDRKTAWAPLSLDPPATATALLGLLGGCALAMVCAGLRGRGGRSSLSWAVVAVGGIFALSAIAHTVLRPEAVFGLYRPAAQTWGFVRAPLVNSNHIAGVFALVAPMTFAIALGEEGLRRRLLVGLGALEMGLGLATLSRGGAIAIVLGPTLLAVGLARRRDLPSRLPRWEVAAGAGLALACAAYLGQGQFEQILSRTRATGLTSEVKVRVWADALQMVQSFPAFGVGRGAFVVTFPRYRSISLRDALTFDHPENLLVQLVSEWGVVVGGLTCLGLVVGVGWAWRKRGMGRVRTGALAGLIALLLQNLADFSLEVPGVSALAVVVGSLALPEGRGDGERPRRRWPAVAVAVALIACLAALGPTVALHGYRADGERLARALSSSRRMPAEARAILDRHPADYALPLLVGQWSAQHSRQDTLRWLNRALYLNPRGGSVHVAIGQTLWAAGLQSQAMMELRLAQREEPARGHQLAEWIVRRRDAPLDLLDRFIGTGRQSGARAIYVAEALRDAGRHADYAEICGGLARRVEPSLRDWGLACLAEAQRLLGNRAEALSAARTLVDRHPTPDLLLRAVEVEAWGGATEEAARAVDGALARDPAASDVLTVAARLALRSNKPERALELARRLESTAGTDASIVVSALVLQGRARLAQGEPLPALGLCERALSASRDETDALTCLCEVAIARRDRTGARMSCAELRSVGRLEPRLATGAAELLSTP